MLVIMCSHAFASTCYRLAVNVRIHCFNLRRRYCYFAAWVAVKRFIDVGGRWKASYPHLGILTICIDMRFERFVLCTGDVASSPPQMLLTTSYPIWEKEQLRSLPCLKKPPASVMIKYSKGAADEALFLQVCAIRLGKFVHGLPPSPPHPRLYV